MSIQKKIMVSMVSLCSVLLLSLTMFVLVYNIKAAKDHAIESIEASIKFGAQELNNMIVDSENIAEIVQNDSNVQMAIRSDAETNTPEWYSQKINTNTSLIFLQSQYTRYIDGINVLLDDGRKNKTSTFPFYDTDFTIKKWYQDIRNNPIGSDWWNASHYSLTINDMSEEYIEMGRPLINFRSGEICGIVLLEMKADHFQSILNTIMESAEGLEVIVTAHNQIIMSSGNIDFLEGTEGNNYFSTYFTNTLENGWEIGVSCNWLQVAKDSVILIAMVTLLAIVILLTISVYVSKRIARSIQSPIDALLRDMEYVEKAGFNRSIDMNSNLEDINKLLAGYNGMVKRINELFLELEEKQRTIRRAQYAALQAQINPHFLYNTLDMISWQIRINETEKALKSLMAFSKYYRLTLSKGDEIVSLAGEMEHAIQYLEIEVTRYEEQFEYEIINCLKENSIESCYVPKLILQPLIENAIYHGICEKEEDGKIRITLTEEDTNLMIEVYDNGEGISQENLKHINNLLKDGLLEDEQDKSGYGIYNINQRIRILFGTEYGVSFQSEEKIDTKVKLKLPFYHKKSVNVTKTAIKETFSTPD